MADKTMSEFTLTPAPRKRGLKKLSKKPWVPPEQEDQKALVKWAREYCRLQGIDMLFSVPNQVPLHGPQLYATVNWLKAMGMENGVPDLLLLAARGGFCGLALETKRRGFKEDDLPDDQKKWRDRLRREGYCWAYWQRFEEGREIIEQYLQLPPTIVGNK